MDKIRLSIYFSHRHFPTGVSQFAADIPPTMQPHGFCVGEDSPEHPISEYEAALENLGGHFLHSHRCRYNVQKRKYHWVMTCNDVPPDDVELLLEAASQASAQFGYCCLKEEVAHRNWYETELGENIVEAWTGLSFDEVLPGFYWRTFVSMDSVTRLGLAHLENEPRFQTNSAGLWFRTSGGPSRWGESQELLDRICREQESVFSLSSLRAQLDSQTELLALAGMLKRIK